MKEKYGIHKESRDQKVSYAQKHIKTFGVKDEYIHPTTYRPFDERYTYFTNKSKGWEYKFPPRSVHKPIIIKGDKIYAPTSLYHLFAINSFSSKSEIDSCRFDVYTIKE